MYQNASLYISFDYESFSEKPSFVFNNLTAENQCPSILSTGFCCQDAECHVGDISSDCLVGGGGGGGGGSTCPNGILISFWYLFGGEDHLPGNTVDTDEIVVLKAGHLQMSVRYEVGAEPTVTTATGYIQWKESTCKYSFSVPVKSWVHAQVLLKDNTMELFFNGKPLTNVESACQLDSLPSTSTSNRLVVGYLTIDEFSMFPWIEGIPDLYSTLITGEMISILLKMFLVLDEK